MVQRGAASSVISFTAAMLMQQAAARRSTGGPGASVAAAWSGSTTACRRGLLEAVCGVAQRRLFHSATATRVSQAVRTHHATTNEERHAMDSSDEAALGGSCGSGANRGMERIGIEPMTSWLQSIGHANDQLHAALTSEGKDSC